MCSGVTEGRRETAEGCSEVGKEGIREGLLRGRGGEPHESVDEL